MSGLYLYALLDGAPRAVGTGLAAERLQLLMLDTLVAVVGEMAAAPSVDAQALRGHDIVVRALAENAEAILPARFGCFVASAAALREALGPRAEELGDALRLVRGCEQMTVRIYGEPAPGTDDAAPAGGPGTGYLVGRLRERQRARTVPELDGVRPALAHLVRGERAQRHTTPPLLASVYHLVERGAAVVYQHTIEEAIRGLGHLRLRVSGPFAPYAFAPELLA